MYPSLRKWLQISFFNLMLIAFIGVVLRYKIAFSLPFINQGYLLHAHSHFAFAGWITQVLMALLVANLSEKNGSNFFNKYRWILYANLITAYGMLFTFPFLGYGFLSILFSTLSVFVSYVFAFLYWKDLRNTTIFHISHSWFKVALLCSVISSLGPFSLAYMMAVNNIQQNWYLASVYFFLHFQYNGWFFFACMGLLAYLLGKYDIPGYALKRVYQLFAISCFPTVFLSMLWWPIPSWLYSLVMLTAVCQLAGWWLLIRVMRRHILVIKKKTALLPKCLFVLSAIALTIKLCLQTASVFPSLSQLAFGFRPIVIGYLHLVLLGIISVFILAYVLTLDYISFNRTARAGIVIFVLGILLNEALLMVQGIADINYQGLPFINPLLLMAACVLLTGMVIFNVGFLTRTPGSIPGNHRFL